MKAIKNFNDMINHLSSQVERKKVAVVWAADDHTPEACAFALEKGIVDIIFVGCQERLVQREDLKPYCEHIAYVGANDPDDSAAKAVALVREGKADILMKGLINTDNLLHAVLNKETGILPKGSVLTHVTTAEIPGYDRLLLFTDAAVIPYPTQEQRIQQVRYMTKMCHSFGIEEPKISLIHCTEKPNKKYFPFTLGYQEIIDMAKAGEFGRCVVDGPLDLKTSCDNESMKTKGIDSPLNGEADALIMPDIEAGNVFYKAITLFAGASTAGILQGPIAPVVIASRADSSQSKFYSLAVAAMCK